MKRQNLNDVLANIFPLIQADAFNQGKQFVFEPAQRQFSMVNELIKGTASFISGKMTKLSPDSVILETPSATIGVRGTTYHVMVRED